MLSRTLVFGLALVFLGSVSSAQDKEKKSPAGKNDGKVENRIKKRIIILKKDDDEKAEIKEKVIKAIEKTLKKFDKELGAKESAALRNRIRSAVNNDGPSSHAAALGILKRLKTDQVEKMQIEKLNGILKRLPQVELDLAEHLDFTKDTQLILNDEKRKVIGITLKSEGDNKAAVVQSVFPKSPAEQAGLKAGDKVVAVNGKKVTGIGGLVEMITKTKKKSISVEVVRGDKKLSLELKPKPANTVFQHGRVFFDPAKIREHHDMIKVDPRAIWKVAPKSSEDDKLIMPHQRIILGGSELEESQTDLKKALEEVKAMMKKMQAEINELKGNKKKK